MTAVQLLTCVGMIVGAFLIPGLKPVEFTDSLFAFLLWKKSSIREDIRALTNRKRAGPLKKGIVEAQAALEMTRRSRRFSLVCAISLALFCTGGSITILLDNFLAAPALAMGFMLLPFWHVKPTTNHYKKDIVAELGTAPSVITTAYLRTEDIMTAVDENIAYLSPLVSKVSREFLMRIKLVNPDAEVVLRTVKSRIDNEVFQEQCDTLCDYQHDHSLKTTLTPIITKLSDVRNINAKLEYLVAEPRKESLIMMFFVIGSIPLMHLLNQEWYSVLMYMPLEQIILAVTAAAIFTSANFAVRLTHPIEYRR